MIFHIFFLFCEGFYEPISWILNPALYSLTSHAFGIRCSESFWKEANFTGHPILVLKCSNSFVANMCLLSNLWKGDICKWTVIRMVMRNPIWLFLEITRKISTNKKSYLQFFAVYTTVCSIVEIKKMAPKVPMKSLAWTI